MSTKAADEPKASTSRAGSSESSEVTIKPSEEFLQLFQSSYAFFRDPSKFSKKQISMMEARMQKLFKKATKSKGPKLDDIITLAYTYNHVCIAYINASQKEKKLYAAKDCVLRFFHLTKDIELHPQVILQTMQAYFNLASIHCKQQKIENAAEIYHRSIESCLQFMEKEICPVDVGEIILKSPAQENGFTKLKRSYLFVLHSLIDLHTRAGPADHEDYIACSHLLLLDEYYELPVTKKYKQWIEKAIELSGHLLMHGRFREARSHIFAAMYVETTYMGKKYTNVMKSPTITPKLYKQCVEIYEMLNRSKIRYCVALLDWSARRLLRLRKDEDFEGDDSTAERAEKSKEQPPQKFLLFDQTDVKYLMDVYQPLPSKYLTRYIDAYKIFCTILRMTYDSLRLCEKHTRIYTQCVFLACNAYKYLALYEKDISSRLSLHYWRADILLHVTDPAESQQKSNAWGLLKLQLAITYSAMIETKLEDIETSLSICMSQKRDDIIVEINVLLAKSYMSLKQYIEYNECNKGIVGEYSKKTKK